MLCPSMRRKKTKMKLLSANGELDALLPELPGSEFQRNVKGLQLLVERIRVCDRIASSQADFRSFVKLISRRILEKNAYQKVARYKTSAARLAPERCCIAVSVQLRRDGDEAFGISVAGGADREMAPFICSVKPGSMAHRSDSLLVGDVLLEVNAISVASLKHDDILTLLKGSGETVTLLIEYNICSLSIGVPPSDKYTNRCIEVMLKKECCKTGITFRGGSYGPDANKSRPITIMNIRSGSPADRDNRIRVGDRILAINDICVENATHATVANLLDRPEDTVTLLIQYSVAIRHEIRSARGPVVLEVDHMPGSDLGLGITESDGNKRSIFVDTVAPGTTADRCGGLQVGDELLSVNGTLLSHALLAEVRELLKSRHRTRVRLEIVPLGCVQNMAPNASNKHRRTAVNRSNSESLADSRQGASIASSTVPRNAHGYAEIVRAPTLDFKSSKFSIKRNLGIRTSRSGTVSATISGLPSGQVCRSEVMEVVLNSWSRGGYGLLLHRNLSSPADDRSPLIICYIEKGGPADRSEVLQVGDRVLAINDYATNAGSSDDANNLLKRLNGAAVLVVEFDVIESVLPNSGIFTVKLAKRKQNLGVVISGSTSVRKGEPVIVSDVRIGSVAHRCGSIFPGDQLISIDNIPLDTCTVEEAVRLLQRSSDIVKLRVKKNSSTDDGNSFGQTVVYSIELNRKGGPLGITIAGTDERCAPVFISQLALGGLAEKTGALHVGDRLLAINGHSLKGKRVSEAIDLLQHSTDVITLKVAHFVFDHPRFCYYVPLDSGAALHHRQLESAPPYDNTPVDKLCTPVQSIDSAVESLDESPLLGMHQNSSSSNRNSTNSKSSSGSAATDNHHAMDELTLQLDRVMYGCRGVSKDHAEDGSSSDHLPFTDSPSKASNDQLLHYSDDDVPYSPDSVACLEQWEKVLESLETVGEEQILQMLEDTILAGSVPYTSPVPPIRSSFNSSFPAMNTILKQPLAATSWTRFHDQHSQSSSPVRTMIVSKSFTGLGIAPKHKNFPILSNHDHPGCACSSLSVSPCFGAPSMSKMSNDPTLKFKSVESPSSSPQLFTTMDPGFASPIILTFELHKDGVNSDFGFSVSDSVGHNGVYINNIRPAGPASKGDNIRPYDHLLQVNGSDVQDLDCLRVVPLLASCGDSVSLTLKRYPNMASTADTPSHR